MAAAEPRQRHPAARPQAEAVERFVGVAGAGRQMAAVESHQRGKRIAVGFDQGARGQPWAAGDRTEDRWQAWPTHRGSIAQRCSKLDNRRGSTGARCVKFSRFQLYIRTLPESPAPLKQAGKLGHAPSTDAGLEATLRA